MTNKEVLTHYVKTMTTALKNAGVKHVIISPGSRSTPLAYAFASDDAFSITMQVDERSAGFYALGVAKATLQPVVLLCTSGTAASNYYPAITEAHYARLPLIVLTSDRPHELREVGAPQAIDQIHMYGHHVKWSVDLPLAEQSSKMTQFIERHVQRGTSLALTAPMGPVHYNVPFREPLLIEMEQEEPEQTFIQRLAPQASFDQAMREEVRQLLSQADSGIIVAGELPITFDTAAFWTFAGELGWPVLCDPLSNLRTNVPAQYEALCIDQYDALLKSPTFCQNNIPHTVLRIGAQPVSKPLALFLKQYRPEQVIVVDEAAQYRDFLGVATHHIQAQATVLFDLHVTLETTEYALRWKEANSLFTTLMQEKIEHIEDEGAFAYTLFESLQDGVDLISSSSMPIRDVDTFFNRTEKDIQLFANRGTNGIDGVISTALGIQQARKRPTYLLIGDLAFLHDVNGLIATRFSKTNLTIIIMNNDGGGIFSYLPQAKHEAAYFEQLFGTPTGLTFEHIAAMYEAQYDAVYSIDAFKAVLKQEKTAQLRIIEVFTDREKNVAAHRQLWEQMIERLE